MISNLRISGVNLVVVAGFAVAGVLAVCWVAAGWAERAADWLRRDRVTPLLENGDKCSCGKNCPVCENCWRWWCECICAEDGLPPLPPERTWEQMTGHQLPVVDTQRPEFWTPENQALLRPERERRAPWWESFHRAQYAALDLEYPSGLMARVRELAP